MLAAFSNPPSEKKSGAVLLPCVLAGGYAVAKEAMDLGVYLKTTATVSAGRGGMKAMPTPSAAAAAAAAASRPGNKRPHQRMSDSDSDDEDHALLTEPAVAKAPSVFRSGTDSASKTPRTAHQLLGDSDSDEDNELLLRSAA
jgi:hypothetical protein